MALDNGNLYDHCFCNKPRKKSGDDQNRLDNRNVKFVVSRHNSEPEEANVKNGALEMGSNETQGLLILHNDKDVEKVSDEILLQLDENTISCPQCRHLLENTQRLLYKVSTVDKKVTLGICDHCKTKRKIGKSCIECVEIVKSFITGRGVPTEETKHQIKIWLLKVKDLLQDVLIDVNESRKLRSRTYSDPYISEIAKFPSRSTAPEPEVKQMYQANQPRGYSHENIPRSQYKELPEFPEVRFMLQRKESLIIDRHIAQSNIRQPKTSILINSTTRIRKYHSDETLHATMSQEKYAEMDFNFSFPKSNDNRQDSEHHISSAELISNTQNILRKKAKDEKLKRQEEKLKLLEDNVYKQVKGLVREKKTFAAGSETKLTKNNYGQKEQTNGTNKKNGNQGNQILNKVEQTIVKDAENMLVNSKTDTFSVEEKKQIVKEKKQRLVELDTNQHTFADREKQKKEAFNEKQYTRDKKVKIHNEKKRDFGGDAEKKNSDETITIAKRDTKKHIDGEAMKTPGGERKKNIEGESKRLLNKTKTAKENNTVLDISNKDNVQLARGDTKRAVEGDPALLERNRKGPVADSKMKRDIEKKQVDEKIVNENNDAKYNNLAKENMSQGEKTFVDKDIKKITQQNDIKTTKPTDKYERKRELDDKTLIQSNISAKKPYDILSPNVNKNKADNREELNANAKKVDDEYLMVEKYKNKEKNVELKRNKDEISIKGNLQEPIKHKDNIGEKGITNVETKEIHPKNTNKHDQTTDNKTNMGTDKNANESAEINYKKAKDKSVKTSELEQPRATKNIELPTIQELRMESIKVRKMSQNDLTLSIKIKPGKSNQTKVKDSGIVSLSAFKKNKESSTSGTCVDSDFELDEESEVFQSDKPMELANIIIGQKLFKYKPPLKYKQSEHEDLVTTESKEELTLEKKGIEKSKPEEIEHPVSSLNTKATKSIEQEIPKGITRYALSDRSFIDKGWTMLPTEKVVRKMNVYRMRPAHPEFDWFEHNKNKRLMQYDTGEKLAEFDDNGRGRWYYKSGQLALDYYDAEEANAQQRFVVYSSGEPDKRGRSHPITILATFDYLGNGIVFDHSGKLRLKYNQTEGVVLDREIGPVSHWKWHTLNDPPVLQQVMIDTQLPHKDPEIMKLGGPSDRKARPDNEEMIAIEFDNFINEKSKKLTQTFKPFQIKMKALKINEHFSLRVLDQATIYLIFRDGSTNIKMNIGMLLDHKEIVDTDTAEVGEVSNNLERFPARTDSIAGLQRNVAHAQRFENLRVERERRIRPPALIRSVDRLTAGASHPLRSPLRTLPSGSTAGVGECYCRHNRKPSINLYYDTRLV